jgi:hypothetical protein
LQKHRKVSELHLEGLLKPGENTVALVGRTPNALLGLEITFADAPAIQLGTDSSWETAHGLTEDAFKKASFSAKAAALPQENWAPALAAAEPGDAELQTGPLHKDYVWALQPQPPARSALLKADLLMRTLGRPNRDQIVTSRPQDLSTLEALDLSAGARLSELLAGAASRIAKQATFTSPNELVDWLYRAALGREPSEGERSVSLEALGEKPTAGSIEDFLWSVFVLPEFQLVR